MTSKNQHNSNILIIIFTRFPEAGKAKTRLIPAIGPRGAADLQKKMTEFTVRQAELTGFPLQIRYTGGTEAQLQEWLGPQHEYAPQPEGNLGARMKEAFEEAFNSGRKKVLVIGSDCPDNRSENMLEAIKLLDETSCVLGPAMDGGYYLIGLTRIEADLFTGIEWGTASVFDRTIEKITDYKLLPTLSDVDELCDIPSKISVVIPALNEERNIESTIRQVLEGFNTEAIVVDGGSNDRTPEIASAAGAEVVLSQPGRASQMNAGASQANGEVLLFLHADSILPVSWDLHVRRIMKQPDIKLGFFRFAVQGDFRGRKWVEWGTNIRSCIFKRPYGDQGLFLRKTDFVDMQGFPNVPILEDVMLVKKVKKTGRIQSVDVALTTSGRRWMQHGALKTTLINQYILLAARFGADLESLSSTYSKKF